MNQKEISETDKVFLAKLRENIRQLTERVSRDYDYPQVKVLDVAPQVHEGASLYFQKAKVETLDIDPNSGATYITDLCQNNSHLIDNESFDLVMCTEVLEHTLDPFAAVREIFRILKPGGIVAASTPFNFRIHGPLPDCWRFTEHGLRVLFKSFETVMVEALEDEERFLMPIHYTLIAKKK